MRDAAGQLADRVHLLLLLDLVFERPPLGIVERVDDRGFRIAVAIFVNRCDEEGREAFGSRRQCRFDRRNIALALACHGNRLFEGAALAFGDGRQDAALGLARALEHAGEQGIGAHDPARSVDGRDCHRGIVEEAHEAHFGGALRILVFAARAVQYQCARWPGRTVGAEGHLMEQPDRNRAAVAGLEVEVEDFGFDFARHRRQRQKRSPLARHDVGEFQAAGSDFREILVEPACQRGIQIDDVARGIGGEKTGRRVIEIVDRVLQFLEDIFLLLAVPGDIGDAPDRGAVLAAAAIRTPARPNPQPQPASRFSGHSADTHLFLQAASLARSLQQPVDRFRYIGIAEKNPLDRPDVLCTRSTDQVEIDLIGVQDAAPGIGDQNAVEGAVHQAADFGAFALLPGKAQNSRGQREQRKHPDGAQNGKQDQDIKGGIAAPDLQQPDRSADQHDGNQEHQPDTAAALRSMKLHLAQICCRHDS